MNEEKETINIDEETIEKGIERWFQSKFTGKGKTKSHKCTTSTGAGAGVYCVGLVGAAVYYIGAATTFWGGVLGFLKACVWPAFLVHGLLKYLGL